MDAKTLELALRKQRVQLASERLRHGFINRLDGVSPVFHTADRLRDSALWLEKHPQVFIAIGVAFIVARPKRALGWARRAFIGWQVWRRLRSGSAPEIFKKIRGRLSR
ncbi:MAG: YqjK family protein [Rugosibacter sp.]